MGLYNANEMPLSDDPRKRAIQEKLLRGEKLTIFENTLTGRDYVIKKIGNYECKPDHCYRTVSTEAIEIYGAQGYIADTRQCEYIPGENNGGIDWYLGGACPSRYGHIIIECPAHEEYFTPTHDHGLGMARDLHVRHMKSSSNEHPVPVSMITNVFDYSLVAEATFDEARQKENTERAAQRQEQLMAMIRGQNGGRSI